MSKFGRRILIFGGTGSLGKALMKRFSADNLTVVSRDEEKIWRLKQDFSNVTFHIGDIRDSFIVEKIIQDLDPDIIINAAAMKQVPACEDQPFEAVKTNILGTQNIVSAIEKYYVGGLFSGKIALTVSTDKASKPINSYGMTKALQERIHLNGASSKARFVGVRYGNVLESRGSVIPYFKTLIEKKQPLTITHPDMTRFLLTLDSAVDLIDYAIQRENYADHGKIYIPELRSCKVIDLAEVMCKHYGIKYKPIFTGIRPGEKLHEVLFSEEEASRVKKEKDGVYSIAHVNSIIKNDVFKTDYSSANFLMNQEELYQFLLDADVLT